MEKIVCDGYLTNCMDTDGTLMSHAFPGGYPIFYVDGNQAVLCPNCANESVNNRFTLNRPKYAGINWEDTDLYCDECLKQIESAYGE